MKSIRSLIRGLPGMGALLLCAAGTLPAQAPKASPHPNLNNPHVKMVRLAPSTADRTAAASQLAFIDPVTHQIRKPDPVEASNLRNKAVSVQGATVVSPTGAIGVIADESTMSFLVASKARDGNVKTACVTGKKKAVAISQGKQKLTSGALDVR